VEAVAVVAVMLVLCAVVLVLSQPMRRGHEAMAKVDEAVKFADKSPFPDLDSLYDDVYVYGEQVKGWYTVDERSPDVHRGEEERDAPEISHKLAQAGAAYAGTGDQRPEDVEDSEEAD